MLRQDGIYLPQTAAARFLAQVEPCFRIDFGTLPEEVADDRIARHDGIALNLQDGGSTRQVLSDGFRDLQASQLAGFQRVLDTMCNYQIQAKDEKIADLQRQLGEANSARLMENLGNRIVANNEAQTTTLEQYLAPKANPAWIVQNPNCCGNQSPYGCGCSYN